MSGPHVIAAAPGWRVMYAGDEGETGFQESVLAWYIEKGRTLPVTFDGVLDPDTESFLVVSPDDDEVSVLIAGRVRRIFPDPEEACLYLQERAEMRRAC
jgi:hypothetical protein